MRKGFTLVELLIGIAIVGVLIVLIFRIYIYMSMISIRIENEKTISNEVLYLSQVVQNLADNYQVDYSGYSDLRGTYGLVKSLKLKSGSGSLVLYSTGDCDSTPLEISGKNCWIQMNDNGKIVDITDKNKVYFSKFYFKILPYEDANSFYLDFADIYHSSIGMYLESYVKRYSKKDWQFDVSLNFQTFYNIRQY